jgi:2'-5' RNA ligase
VEIRCFLAINFPSELKARLAELEADLKGVRADVSWVKAENIHLTLKFLGEVGEERISSIQAAIREGFPEEGPLSLSLAGLGTFPNPRSPRVIWVGVEGEKERLLRLQERLERAMEKLGFPREARAFSPHITLGRVRSRQGCAELMGLVDRLQGCRLGDLEARTVELMRSQLHPTGAVYSILESFPLLASHGSNSK